LLDDFTNSFVEGGVSHFVPKLDPSIVARISARMINFMIKELVFKVNEGNNQSLDEPASKLEI
jgi:hypothetical protein